MTKENVVNIIRHVFHYYDEQHTDYNWSEFNEACGIVIDLLENNKIEEELEKIREENKTNRDEWIKGEDAEWSTYDKCISIIDKYKKGE